MTKTNNLPIKTKKAMKQTMNYLSMAALVVMGAIMAGCAGLQSVTCLATDYFKSQDTKKRKPRLTTSVFWFYLLEQIKEPSRDLIAITCDKTHY